MKSYVLENKNLRIHILSYGAVIQKIEMPNRDGKWENIVLGFENPADYETKNTVYFGAVVGRTAGRTKDGLLEIGNEFFELDCNAGGFHSIHGGKHNLSNRDWEGKQEGNSVILTVKSSHLENGYPGNVNIQVKYTLEEDTLHIEYEGISDEDTYLNLTNHTYFSLSGNQEETIDEQLLQIDAEEYLEVDEDTIPIRIAKTKGTAFDFQKPAPCKQAFYTDDSQVGIVGGGIDHPFLTSVARLEDPKSGRAVEIKTDNKSIVIYTANWLHEIGRKDHTGICFEAQDMPGLSYLNPKEYKVGKVYRRKTMFRFTVVK